MKKIVSITIIGILIISGVGASAISLKNPVKSSSISEYDLVIIAPDMFSDALQPFIDHKNSFGVQTFLKTTEDIYDDFTGEYLATYLGGSNGDGGFDVGITIDSFGNIFVVGTTDSDDFPVTTGAYDESYNGQTDIFIGKMDSELSTLIAATYLGGSATEGVNCAITSDEDGNVFVIGYTASSDFPVTSSAYDKTYNGGGDVFVSKFDNDLTTLLGSTYLGGSGVDAFRSEASIFYKNNLLYTAGMTSSYDFPTTINAYSQQFNGGGGDAFVTLFTHDLSNITASSYFGGNENEEWAKIAVDDMNNVFIAGFTQSANLPTTPGSFDETYNADDDAFIVKFNSDISNVIACSYFGGSRYDNIYCMNIDYQGNILLGGHGDPGYPTTSGAYTRYAFLTGRPVVTKINNDLTTLIGSTFIRSVLRGGVCVSIDSDSEGNVYVSGYTRAILFPTTRNAFDRRYNGGVDIFVSVFNPILSNLIFSTFIGGSSDDELGTGLAVKDTGIFYLGSGTTSLDLPMSSTAYDDTFNGVSDCCLFKITW